MRYCKVSTLKEAFQTGSAVQVDVSSTTAAAISVQSRRPTSLQKISWVKVFGMQVNGLDSLVKALNVEVKDMRKEKDRAIESHTVWGNLKNSMGYLLSVYCLVRQAHTVMVLIASFHTFASARKERLISLLNDWCHHRPQRFARPAWLGKDIA